MTGQAYHPDAGKFAVDLSVGLLTFGLGSKLGVGRSAEDIAANRVYGPLLADQEGAAPLVDFIANKGIKSSLHPVYTRLIPLIGLGQAGYQVLTQVGGDLLDLAV